MKKISVFILSMGLIFSTYTSVSAIEAPQLEKTDVTTSSRATNQVDQTKYRTMHPDDIGQHGGSASVIYHSLSAQRQNDGSVIVIIKETFHTVRGYYEHLATDTSGDNFVPNKNTAYYTPAEGVYSITLAADSVSTDGYVYLKFAIAPEGIDYMVNIVDYKIPVDYDSNKVVSARYLTLGVGQQITPSASASYINFDAKAMRLADSTVEVFINLHFSNTSLWFNHDATGADGGIFIPQKDTWYHLGSGTQENKAYRFILPENSVSSDGYVYLDVCFDLPSPNEMYSVQKIKLAIL